MACAVLFLVTQSCLTVIPWTVARQAPLSKGILQARILEWVARLSSRGSSQLRNGTGVSCFAGGFFTSWATRQAPVTAYAYALWKFLEFKTYGKPVLEPYSQNTGSIGLVFNNFPFYSALIHQEQNAMAATHLLGEMRMHITFSRTFNATRSDVTGIFNLFLGIWKGTKRNKLICPLISSCR